jgi:molybdopterin converting factor small subunit
MSVTVRVPTTLRTMTGGQSEVVVDGATVGEVLAALEAAHPGIGARILDDEGAIRRFVNVFVADDDVRFLDGLDTQVPSGETLSIIPAVAGGAI